MTDPVLSVRLESVLLSIPEGRRFVRDVLSMWGVEDEARSAVLVLVGELVTNAILHAAPPIDVAIRSHGRRVRVEVADDSNEMPVLIEPPRPQGRGGYGLRLLASMADTWGAELHSAGGKTVWFEIETQGWPATSI